MRQGRHYSLAATRDESRALEHPQVLGDSGHAHVEGFGQFGDRAFAGQEPREDGPARRVGESGERHAEVVGRHCSNEPIS
jgi:hypothetical protein